MGSNIPNPDSRPRFRHNLVLLGAASLVVAADHLTKWWALETLADRDIHLFWTVRFNLVYNTGGAFGLGQSLHLMIGIISLLFVIAVTWASWGGQRLRLPPALLGMVLGGAIGNLVDRVAREGDGFFGGGVVDFVDFQWWPVFNVADASIVIAGVGLVVIATRSGHFRFADEPDGLDEATAPDEIHGFDKPVCSDEASGP